MKFLKIVTITAVLVIGAAQANALIWIWTTTTMSGLEEVPPNGTPATGLVNGTLDDVSGLVTVVSGSYSGLLAPITGAHIHGLAAAGANAGVLIGLTHTGGTSGSLSGSGVLSAANVAGMISGLTYVNVHSSAFPGGEIRGQIHADPVPEPATLIVLGSGIALALRRRRK